jgi:DNA polymerase III subunit gamma/tau
MTQALYRKWRPQTFDDLVGQQHVTQTLRNALASGRVGHAYLFAGLRGTGKTTTARLLAKAVNCLAEDPALRPCNVCAVCKAVNAGRLLDLIEIDAASHTSVDDVRELRDKIGFRPNECRYKVYIIDEVHRFSGSAFDALLKTIEEPPAHAIFILATTEIHKVPPTILSRCQRFDFRRIPSVQIVGRLRKLLEAEGGEAEPEALALIARSATGSLRDAESLLDQLMAADGGAITLAQVQATLGTIDAELVAGLVDSLAACDVAAGLDWINRAIEQGADLRQFTRQIVEHLREMMLIQLGGAVSLDHGPAALQALEAQAGRIDTVQLVAAVKRFNQAETELRGGWQPQLPLELAWVELVAEQDPGVMAAPRSKETSVAPAATVKPEPAPAAPVDTAPADVAPADATPAEVTPDTMGTLNIDVVRRLWPQVLAAMKARDRTVQALLNSAHPCGVQEDTVVLGVEHAFAQDKLSHGTTRQLIIEVLNEVYGQPCQVEYQLASSSQDPVAQWAVDELRAEVRPINEGSEA